MITSSPRSTKCWAAILVFKDCVRIAIVIGRKKSATEALLAIDTKEVLNTKNVVSNFCRAILGHENLHTTLFRRLDTRT